MPAARRRESSAPLDSARALADIDDLWEREIVRELGDYIRIPAKSSAFDAQWSSNGYLDLVARNAAAWIESQKVEGLTLEIVRLAGRTPVLFVEIAATRPDDGRTVMLYGHLDKQRESVGWREGLGPWTPVREGDRLYGRGAADDGYAVYATIAAVQALKAQQVPHARIVALIETSEESGSPDLLAYLDALRERIGDVALAICLDSVAGNYDQLWLTSSLGGIAVGTFAVEFISEELRQRNGEEALVTSLHMLRDALERLRDPATGRRLPASFHCDIPQERIAQAEATAAILGDEVYKGFSWAHDCGGPTALALPTTSPAQALIDRTWKPNFAVSVTPGFPRPPGPRTGGPDGALNLVLRVPPLVDAGRAIEELRAALEDNASYEARVTFSPAGSLNGWNAPGTASWFQRAIDDASHALFGAPCAHIGQTGTIPFMHLVSQRYPSAQAMVCGVLGPRSNAHGPNEFLHVPYATKVTAAVAEVIARVP